MFLMIPNNLLTIWLNGLLALRWQENGNNWWIGLIILVLAAVLLVVFWQWWQAVAEEDWAKDLRMVNARPGLAADGAVTAAHYTLAEAHEHAPDTNGHEDAAATAVAPEPKPEPEPESETDVPDDLTVIEGVGPKISGLLHNAGIVTYAQLAQAEASHVAQILAEAGTHYRLADPTTWPEQAALAAAGKWEELAELQDSLRGGREAE